MIRGVEGAWRDCVLRWRVVVAWIVCFKECYGLRTTIRKRGLTRGLLRYDGTTEEVMKS